MILADALFSHPTLEYKFFNIMKPYAIVQDMLWWKKKILANILIYIIYGIFKELSKEK